jgi:hypothetical protein
LKAIKDALREVLERRQNRKDIKMPLVTLVVAQSFHGVQIVPKNQMGRDQNVPSGTCLELGLQGIQSLTISDLYGENTVNLLPDEHDYLPIGNASSRQSNFEFQLIPHK